MHMCREHSLHRLVKFSLFFICYGQDYMNLRGWLRTMLLLFTKFFPDLKKYPSFAVTTNGNVINSGTT